MERYKKFKAWLVEHRHQKNGKNLSVSSAYKYARAINTISEDMINAGVLEQNLYNITFTNELIDVIYRIKGNVFFQNKNSIGHNMYSVALDHYLNFVRAIESKN
jgi:hypothetical protein